jgi:hypothetical protein
MTTTEAPNTSDGAPSGRTENGSAGTDLDKLLSEFESPNPGIQPRAEATVLKALKPVIDFADAEMTTRAKAALDGDIAKAVDFVKEEAKDIPPRLVRGFLEGYAAENQAFRHAFENRHTDPNTWQTKLGEARGEFVKEIGSLPGNTVKSDVEAARAAIAGRSEPIGDKPELSAAELVAMPQHEFDALWKKQAAANAKR